MNSLLSVTVFVLVGAGIYYQSEARRKTSLNGTEQPTLKKDKNVT